MNYGKGHGQMRFHVDGPFEINCGDLESPDWMEIPDELAEEFASSGNAITDAQRVRRVNDNRANSPSA